MGKISRLIGFLVIGLGVAGTPLLSAFAQQKTFESPFESDISGFSIKNSHYVDAGPKKIIRGQTPKDFEYTLLDQFDVSDVLIFKNETFKKEVRAEVDELKKLGFVKPRNLKNPDNVSDDDFLIEEGDPRRVYYIPFKWRNIDSFQKACEQTIDGLKLLVQVSRIKDRTIFFHCTIGEDRTGYLAGLYRMLNQGWKIDRAFKEEMCENGYEAGNPEKLNDGFDAVVKPIREQLTPIFSKMAYLIDQKAITEDNLDKSVCKSGFVTSKKFKTFSTGISSDLACSTSTKYKVKAAQNLKKPK